jgi:glycosyltransferase involved in cell wall biosynthesis
VRPTTICFGYHWATSGGVERVFLNRSEALLRRYPKLEIEIYFKCDCGGVALIERYSQARKLGDRLRVVKTLDPSRYAAMLVVDTPEILVDHPSIQDTAFMECHTAYAKHRTYLQEWQTRLKGLIVPSSGFQRVIEDECPGLRGRVKVVRNFVPRLPEIDGLPSLPAWRAPLFLYFGRIDGHKNLGEFIDGVCSASYYLQKETMGIVCGQIDPAYSLMEAIERHQARGAIAVLPPVPFENAPAILKMMRQKKAVFVSCSTGESFGLSVAEAMTAGLPVVLSDIPAHATLVGNRAKFLYPLGDVRELATKMAVVAEQYDELADECLDLSREFSEDAFLEDWEGVFGEECQAWGDESSPLENEPGALLKFRATSLGV